MGSIQLGSRRAAEIRSPLTAHRAHILTNGCPLRRADGRWVLHLLRSETADPQHPTTARPPAPCRRSAGRSERLDNAAYVVSFVCNPLDIASAQNSQARRGEPFSVRFTLPTDRVVQEEARRTRRSKSAVVEILAEEAVRTRRFAGIGFRGDEAARRPWVIGSGLDVWEIIQMLEDFGSIGRLVKETQLTERQARLAVAYQES